MSRSTALRYCLAVLVAVFFAVCLASSLSFAGKERGPAASRRQSPAVELVKGCSEHESPEDCLAAIKKQRAEALYLLTLRVMHLVQKRMFRQVGELTELSAAQKPEAMGVVASYFTAVQAGSPLRKAISEQFQKDPYVAKLVTREILFDLLSRYPAGKESAKLLSDYLLAFWQGEDFSFAVGFKKASISLLSRCAGEAATACIAPGFNRAFAQQLVVTILERGLKGESLAFAEVIGEVSMVTFGKQCSKAIQCHLPSMEEMAAFGARIGVSCSVRALFENSVKDFVELAFTSLAEIEQRVNALAVSACSVPQ